MANIVFLDNFDSFTYNLVDQFRLLGHHVTIYRNDADIQILSDIILSQPNTILVLSPGPGKPSEAGILLPLIHQLKEKVAIIGICLGHQAIIEAFGGKVIQSGEIRHGKVSLIEHDNQAMFTGLDNPMPVARYHSLMGSQLSEDLLVNAKYQDIIMAVRHRTLPICGFQFHPESILTIQGQKLLENTINWLYTKISTSNDI